MNFILNNYKVIRILQPYVKKCLTKKLPLKLLLNLLKNMD